MKDTDLATIIKLFGYKFPSADKLLTSAAMVETPKPLTFSKKHPVLTTIATTLIGTTVVVGGLGGIVGALYLLGCVVHAMGGMAGVPALGIGWMMIVCLAVGAGLMAGGWQAGTAIRQKMGW